MQRNAVAAGDGPPRRSDGQSRAISHLPAAWRQLYEWCRDHPYGQFHGLPFRDGEPILTPKPKFVITIKLGKDDFSRRTLVEIAGHPRAVCLRRHLAHWRNGTLRRLTVNDGIPDVVDIEPADQA